MKRRILGFEPRLLRLAVRADVGMIINIPLPEPLPRRAVLRPLVAGPAVRPHQEFDGIFMLGLPEDHLADDVDDGHACVDINQ